MLMSKIRWVNKILRLFKNGDFMYLFFGRLISNAGDSLYTVAAMWLVYELGGSSFYTGLAGFLTMFPQALQFLAGPFVDQWSLRRTLITTQLLQCILVLMIPVAAFMGWLSITVVLIVMPIVAFTQQFAYPAETAALPRILQKEQLVKGNSAFAFAFQGMDLVFNALAGVLVALIGAVSLYFVNSITFVIAMLLFMRLKIPKRVVNKDKEKHTFSIAVRKYVRDLSEGFRFVLGSIMAKVFIGSIVANLAIGSTLAIMPVYADVRGGAETYGFFMAALSAGTLLGALLASQLERFPIGVTQIVLFTVSALFWIGSAFTPWVGISVLFFGFAWVPIGATNVMLYAVLQQIVPDKLLARTISVITSISVSIMPLGSLLGGILGSQFGSEIVFIGTAFGILFVAGVWFMVSELRVLPKPSLLNPEMYGLTEKEYETSMVKKL